MMTVRNRVEGEVQYNDGEFAEVQTNGVEGIENSLLLDTIHIQRKDTDDKPEEFQRRFPVGMWLDIEATTKLTPKGTMDAATLENATRDCTAGGATLLQNGLVLAVGGSSISD
jgi:hypothetical protein